MTEYEYEYYSFSQNQKWPNMNKNIREPVKNYLADFVR